MKKAIEEHALVMFGGSWCTFTKRALSALQQAGMEPYYVEVDDAVKAALKAKTAKTSVPQVFANGEFVGGCNDGGLGGTVMPDP